jgi:hypothetical protein
MLYKILFWFSIIFVLYLLLKSKSIWIQGVKSIIKIININQKSKPVLNHITRENRSSIQLDSVIQTHRPNPPAKKCRN